MPLEVSSALPHVHRGGIVQQQQRRQQRRPTHQRTQQPPTRGHHPDRPRVGDVVTTMDEADGLEHVRLGTVSSGCCDPPRISMPLSVPPQARDLVDAATLFGTIERLNAVLAERSVPCCLNPGWLCCLCIGGMIYSERRAAEAWAAAEEVLRRENADTYAPRGLALGFYTRREYLGVSDKGEDRWSSEKVLEMKLQKPPEPSRAPAAVGAAAGGGAAAAAAAAAAAPASVRVASSSAPFTVLEFAELELEERIGSGAFGDVYRASWRGSAVVVKRLKASLASADAVDEFVAEAELCEKLGRHPHVVRFVGACTRAPDLCLVFQFAELGSVESFLLGRRELLAVRDLPDVVRIAADAASGVLHLHREGVVHRDLAARNVLLTGQRRAVVSDFGMSRVSEAAAEEPARGATVTVVGPLKYMAPEQLARREYSEASDVFAFGVLLWEIFTRTEPWPGVEPLQAAMRVSGGERMRVPPTVPRTVRRLMDRCWAADPAQRPSMAEVHRVLDDYARRTKTVSWSSGVGGGGVRAVETVAGVPMYGTYSELLALEDVGGDGGGYDEAPEGVDEGATAPLLQREG